MRGLAPMPLPPSRRPAPIDGPAYLVFTAKTNGNRERSMHPGVVVNSTVAMRGLIAGLFAVTAFVADPAYGGFDAADPPTPFTKALAWVKQHPATLSEGGFLEITEEIYMFYALRNRAEGAEERAHYEAAIRTRHANIAPYLQQRMERGDYLLDPAAPMSYTSVAEMLAKVGLPIGDYRAIIESMQLFYPAFNRSFASGQLYVSLFLDRLGYQPWVPIGQAIRECRLYREAEGHQIAAALAVGPSSPDDSAATEEMLYEVTHESLALTDFGAEAPPPFVCDRRFEFARLFDDAIRWSMLRDKLDVMSELVISSKLLGLPDGPALREAVATLVGRQTANGSFGITKPERANPYRHGVLTGAVALALAPQQPAVCAPRPAGERSDPAIP